MIRPVPLVGSGGVVTKAAVKKVVAKKKLNKKANLEESNCNV